MNTKVALDCPDCPIGKRRHGSIDFVDGISSLFIFACPRGHTWGIRPLTREERRERPKHAADFVATRWEATE